MVVNKTLSGLRKKSEVSHKLRQDSRQSRIRRQGCPPGALIYPRDGTPDFRQGFPGLAQPGHIAAHADIAFTAAARADADFGT